METCYRGTRRGKELYPLRRPEYTPSSMPTATLTADGGRGYKARVCCTQFLWFLLAQATKRSAVTIATRCEHGGNADGWDAWLELTQVYGGRGQDERPV